MRLNHARIAPVPESEWNQEQSELVAPMVARGPVLNIFRTMLNHPPALKGFLAWGSYILSRRNTLPPRQREIAVLRTGYLCRCGYEWTQHVPIGKHAGLSGAEIAAIKLGADAPGWSAADAVLIRACDDLHHDQFVSETTWRELGAHFSVRQCMDLVFTVGQYTQVSMLLNSFGVQLDEGQALDPDLSGLAPGDPTRN